MGIKNLSKFINTYSKNCITTININELNNKIVGIDAYNILYQMLTAIRNNGSGFTNNNGEDTTHIYAILMKTISLLKKGIKPVYIFDGKAPELKNKTLENRNIVKDKAKIELNKLQLIENKTSDDIKNINKLGQQTTTLTNKHVKECQEILTLLGIPFINAPSEADAQLAYLIKNNYIDYVLSEDMDLLTFGCNKLIRDYKSSKKQITIYNLDLLLKDLNYNMNEFIDLCILLGCDYTDTISGIGLVRAYKLINEHKNIETILKNIKQKEPENFNYKKARTFFINPPVEIINNNFKFKNGDIDKLLEKIIDYYDFDCDYWNKFLKFLNPSKKYTSSKNLFN